MNIIGEVADRVAILVDDMVDTAGTLTMAAEALKKEGAKRIIGCCTHPVLSGPAIKRIEECPLEELIVTNTIPLRSAGSGLQQDQDFISGAFDRRSDPPHP